MCASLRALRLSSSTRLYAQLFTRCPPSAPCAVRLRPTLPHSAFSCYRASVPVDRPRARAAAPSAARLGLGRPRRQRRGRGRSHDGRAGGRWRATEVGIAGRRPFWRAAHAQDGASARAARARAPVAPRRARDPPPASAPRRTTTRRSCACPWHWVSSCWTSGRCALRSAVCARARVAHSTILPLSFRGVRARPRRALYPSSSLLSAAARLCAESAVPVGTGAPQLERAASQPAAAGSCARQRERAREGDRAGSPSPSAPLAPFSAPPCRTR